jgi:hypothetical protein
LGAANIVINGDFEAADLSPWDTATWFLNPGGVGGGQAGSTGCSFEADDCWLYQDLPTEVGVTYTLSFSLAMMYGPPNGLVAYWDGVEKLRVLDLPYADFPPPYGQHIVSGLTATATTTRLQFVGYSFPGTVFLDNVKVDDGVVPEPGTVGLVAGGMFGLFWFARRRKAA